MRGSGDDIKTYFYRLRNAPGSEVRNAFGRRIEGPLVEALGGRAGKKYRLGLRVIGMGDLDAVDIANEVHRCILQSEGGLSSEHDLLYRRPLPSSDTLEGLYIDDHFVVHKCRTDDLEADAGPDRDLRRQPPCLMEGMVAAIRGEGVRFRRCSLEASTGSAEFPRLGH